MDNLEDLYVKFPTFECSDNEQLCEFKEINGELFVRFVPCWKKDQTTLALIPYDEFLSRNFFELSNEVRNLPIPENHNFNCDEHCNSNRGVCDWRHSPLTKVDISIQPFCNVSCKFCVQMAGRDKPELHDKIKNGYFKCLNEIKDHNLIITLTCHGEPLLWKKELFNWLESLTPAMNKGISIVTNSILLEDSDIDFLVRIREEKQLPIHFATSINGTTKKEVEEIQQCTIPNWDKYIERILKLYDLGFLLHLNHVFTIDNVQTLPSFFKFWTEKREGIESILTPLADSWHSKEVTESEAWTSFFKNRQATSANNARKFYNEENQTS